MLSAEGERPLEGLIPAIKCFSLTSLLLISHWLELVTWLSASTGGQGNSFFFVPRKGDWDIGTTTATCQLSQQSWQVFHSEFLVLGFVHFSVGIPVGWNACAELHRLPG